MSFDPFGDFETAGYLQNALQLKDPVDVKESEHLSFELSMEDALGYLAKKRPIDYKAVLKVHEILFSDFYHWAGKDRKELVPILQSSKERSTTRAIRLSNTLTRSNALLTTRWNWRRTRSALESVRVT